MSSFCLICYRVANKNGPSNDSRIFAKKLPKRVDEQRRFFKLLERYLYYYWDLEGVRRNHSRSPFPVEQLAENVMKSCSDCLQRMKSFCQLYHELKTIELRLNWTVQKFSKIMKCSQRVPSRVELLREFAGPREMEGNGVGGYEINLMDFIIASKKSLIANCLRKEADVFPKLSIVKWKPLVDLEGNRDEKSDKMTNLANDNQYHNDVGDSESVLISDNNCNLAMDQGDPSISSLISENENIFESDGLGIRRQEDSFESLELNKLEASEAKETMETESYPEIPLGINDSGSANKITWEISIEEEHETAGMEFDLNLEIDHVEPPISYSAMQENESESRESGKAEHVPPEGQQDKLTSLDKMRIKVDIDHQATNKTSVRNPGNDESIQSPSSPTETSLRLLRRTQSCPFCKKTFSSVDSRDSHVREWHQHDSENDAGVDNDSSSENGHVSQDDDENSSGDDIMSLLSSSSSDEDDEFQHEDKDIAEWSEPDVSEEEYDPVAVCKRAGNKNRGRKRKPHRPANMTSKCAGNEYSFRLKCPDCKQLFESTKDLLVHRKVSEECGGGNSYDPTASINVEILVPDNHETDANEVGNYSTTLAIVELPQRIFICKSCDLALYSSGDMEAHKKLHGSFPCNFCNNEESFAPNLAAHELEHKPRVKLELDGNFQNFREEMVCRRCGSKFGSRRLYRKHFLEAHFSLEYNKPICAICKTVGFSLIPSKLADHFKSHHDMPNITSRGELNWCRVPDCDAYFLSLIQLREHMRLRHRIKDSTVSRNVPPPENVNSKAFSDCNLPNSDSSLSPSVSSELHSSTVEQKISCKVANCKSVFYNGDDYKNHLKFHEKFPCAFCNSVQIPAVDLPWHKISEHSSDPSILQRKQPQYTCPRANCLYSSGNRKNYIRHHLQQHLNLNPNELTHSYTCEICGMIYTSTFRPLRARIQLLEHHEKAHNLKNLKGRDTPFRCDQEGCQAYFVRMDQLSIHKKDVHEIEKYFTCSECNTGFNNNHGLFRHKEKHHAERLMHPCTISGCTFRSEFKRGLAYHIRVAHRKLPKPTDKYHHSVIQRQIQ